MKNSSNEQCILDPIPTRLLKECNSDLSLVVTKIINLSFETSTVPTEFKQAVVALLVKKPNAKLEYKNCRPVSNLPYISKLLEKVIFFQLKEYKQENRFAEPIHTVCKHSHSAQTALLKAFNDFLTKMDDKELVFLTPLDLLAAFDTVDHHILVNRLRSCFGITEGGIKWIHSYLHGKTQKVIVNGRQFLHSCWNVVYLKAHCWGLSFYSDYTSPLGHILH